MAVCFEPSPSNFDFVVRKKRKSKASQTPTTTTEGKTKKKTKSRALLATQVKEGELRSLLPTQTNRKSMMTYPYLTPIANLFRVPY